MKNPVKRKKVRYNFPLFEGVCMCVCVCVRRTFSISRLCRSIRNNYITDAYQSRRWTRQLVKGDTFGVSPISVQAPVFSLPFRETSFIPNVRFSDSSCLSVSRKLPAFFHELTDTLLRVRRNRGYTRERERDIDTKILPLGNVMRPEQMRLTRKKTRQHIGRLKSLDKIEKMESRVKTRRRGLVSDITENITPKCLLRLYRENLPTSPPCSRHGFSRQKITSARSR